jgi:hypothetical protein
MRLYNTHSRLRQLNDERYKINEFQPIRGTLDDGVGQRVLIERECVADLEHPSRKQSAYSSAPIPSCITLRFKIMLHAARCQCDGLYADLPKNEDIFAPDQPGRPADQ